MWQVGPVLGTTLCMDGLLCCCGVVVVVGGCERVIGGGGGGALFWTMRLFPILLCLFLEGGKGQLQRDQV